MTLRLKAVSIAAAATLMLAGCGSSDQDQAKSAVNDYLHALISYDGSGACARLSKATMDAFARLARGQSCASLMSAQARQQLTGQNRQRLQAAKVTKVKVTGNTATATVSVPGRTSTISLVKEGGSWKIQSALG